MPILRYALGTLLVLPLIIPPAYGQASLAVLSDTSFVDELGFLHVIGEIRNDGSSPVRFVSILTTFYDASGMPIATTTGYPFVVVLHPQEKSAFDIVLLDTAKSQQAVSYSFDISSQSASTKPGALRLSIGEGFHDSLGFYHLVGSVENRGSNTATLVSVSSAFYDKDGRIAAVGQEFADPSDIEPGATSPFEIIVLDGDVQAIETASVNVDSSQYKKAADPATPSPPSPSDSGPSSPSPQPGPTPQQTTNSTVTIALDKPRYRFGDIIVMRGNVTGMVPGDKFVVITVTFPGQAPYTWFTAEVQGDGTYERRLLFYGKAGTEDQSYLVNATYNWAIAQNEFTYEVTSPITSKVHPSFDASILFVTAGSSGADSRKFQVEEPILVAATMLSKSDGPFSLIMEIRDKDGFTADLQIVSGIFQRDNPAKVGMLWIPYDAGKYQVRMFAISSLDDPEALSSINLQPLDVN